MADLLDIAPSTAVAVVTVGDLRIKVRGVSIPDMAAIISRFPMLKSIASGGGSDDDFIVRLVAGCGTAVGPIIAAACGRLGDEQYEQRAASLLPEQQLDFLLAIYGLTFPNGISPVIEKLTRLIGGASEKAKGIKVRLKKSHSPSQPSSDAGSRPIMQ